MGNAICLCGGDSGARLNGALVGLKPFLINAIGLR